jgi:hypothetical protein
MLIPPKFVVPSKYSWPENLWCMKLGKAVDMITKQFLDLDRWDDLLSIGYTFDSTEIYKHIQYKNDPIRTVIKYGNHFLKKRSADAYLFEMKTKSVENFEDDNGDDGDNDDDNNEDDDDVDNNDEMKS